MKFLKHFIFTLTTLTFLVSYTHGELFINDDYAFFVDGEDFEEPYEDSTPIDEQEIISNSKFIPNGPLIITDVTRNMKTAGYWISKIKNPDKEILTAKQIQEKNKELFRDLIYLNNIENFSEINTSALRKQQKQIFKMFYYRKFLSVGNKRISP